MSSGDEYLVDSTRAFTEAFVYVFMSYVFFRIFRLVLDLLDPIAEDMDSVPVVPRLNNTVQRLFNRIQVFYLPNFFSNWILFLLYKIGFGLKLIKHKLRYHNASGDSDCAPYRLRRAGSEAYE